MAEKRGRPRKNPPKERLPQRKNGLQGRRLMADAEGNIFEVKDKPRENLPNPTFGFSGWKEKFLVEFADCGSVTRACLIAGISYAYAYRCRSPQKGYEKIYDPAFAESWETAKQMSIDSLELSLYLRAKEFDTVAAIFLLKGLRPEVYAPKSRLEMELATKGGKPLEIQVTAVNYRQAAEPLAPVVIENQVFQVPFDPRALPSPDEDAEEEGEDDV